MQVSMTIGMALTPRTVLPDMESLRVTLTVKEILNLNMFVGTVGNEGLHQKSLTRYLTTKYINPGKYLMHLPGGSGQPAPFLMAWMAIKEMIARGYRPERYLLIRCLDCYKGEHLHIKWTKNHLHYFWSSPDPLFPYCTYETLAPD